MIKKEKDTPLRNQFARELTEWSRTGKKPRSGNQDIAYYLELQRQRLEEHELSMEYQLLEPKAKEDQISGGKSMSPGRQNEKYISKVNFYKCRKRVSFYRGEDRVYTKQTKETMYVTTTDLKHQTVTGAEVYCCPECGAISTIGELREGCPYCQTRFLMSDLFPKVTDYSYMRDAFRAGSVNLSVRLCVIIGIIGALALSLGSGMEPYWFLIIMQIGLAVGMGALLGYLANGLILLLVVLGKAFASLPRLIRNSSARSRIRGILTRIDPALTYEYFNNQLVSALKIILFARDRSNLAVYEGTDPHPEFDDIVETTSDGVIGLKDWRMENGYCTMTLDVPMDVVYDSGRRVREKREVFRVKVCRNTAYPEDPYFSIKKVLCRSCGGSFDATRERQCPYCHTVYDMKADSWVVTDVKRR